MKVFHMNVYMVLPDGFTGGVDEALALWKERRDGPMNVTLTPEQMREACSLRLEWEPFYLNSRRGFSVLCEAGIWFNGYKGWRRLDENPKAVYSNGGTVWAK